MIEVITGILMLLGSSFAFIAALGVLRMPDLYIRMHAATKAGTIGAGFMLLALVVYFGGLGVVVEALAVFIFLLLTAPVAAHAIGRAAYLSGVPLWDQTQFDDYAAYVSQQTSESQNEPEPGEKASQKAGEKVGEKGRLQT